MWASVAFIAIITAAHRSRWGMYVRARRQLVLSLRERAERAEAEQQMRVEQAQAHERARIAREMHDVLAHRISLLSMHAGALEFRPDAPPEEIARAAGVVRASAHQALEDLREVIGVLREESLDGDPERPQPTLANLPGLLDESRQAGMHVSSECRVEDLDGGARGRRAQRLPDRAGGADQRAQARERRGRRRDARRRRRLRADRRGPQPAAGRGRGGRRSRARAPG